MILWVLRISYFCGTFPYSYNSQKKLFVFSKFGLFIFLLGCVCNLGSLIDVFIHFKINGGVDSISRLVIIVMVIFMELTLLFTVKRKMKFFNKILTLYLQETKGSREYPMSYAIFFYNISFLLVSLFDFIHFWFQYTRFVFFWSIASVPNRFLCWSVIFQLVAVCLFLRRQLESLNAQMKELLQEYVKNRKNNGSIERLNKFSYKSSEFYSSYNSPSALAMTFDEGKDSYSFPKNVHQQEIIFINICRKYKLLKANVKELNQLYSSIILFLTILQLTNGAVSINGVIKALALSNGFNKFRIIKMLHFLFRAIRSIVSITCLYQTCSSIEDEVLKSAKIILDSNLKRCSQSFLNLIVSFLHNQHVDKTSFTLLFGQINVNLELSLLFMAGITPLITISIQTYFYKKVTG
ncbi:hypothetical protein WDU94_013279 [Cyamophila willieti]